MNRVKTNRLPRLAQKSCRNFGSSTILAKKRTIPEDWLPVHLRDEAISANLISTRGRALRNFQTLFGWTFLIAVAIGAFFGIQNLVVASAPLVIGELSNEEKEKMKNHEDNSVEQKWVNLSEKK